MNSAVETVSSSDLALKIREASADAVREFVAKSWAPATLRAYSTDWSVFQAWCDAAELEALPAKPMTLALFLADEARRGRAYATVARRVAAVGLVHMRHGVAPPVPSVEVSAVLKGIRKDPERPARSKKAALLEEHLCQMIDAIETDTHLGRRDRALLLIGWCGAFRRSELVALSWSDFEAAPGQGRGGDDGCAPRPSSMPVASTMTISTRLMLLVVLAAGQVVPAVLAAPGQDRSNAARRIRPAGGAEVLPNPPRPSPAPVRGPYLPVTDARLREPEPESWLMYRRTYDGWGFSPLQQIDSSNVVDLIPVWGFQTDRDDGQPQAPPIVNGETMFVTTADLVVALDAATGVLLWRYVHPLPPDVQRPHSTNRGAALYDDKVYVGTLDARVVALEATTGDLVWERAVADYRSTYYITMAPLVVNGKVIVGTSGGEHGIRGLIIALDATTGDEAWRWRTIPAPGEPGSATWKGDAWRTGGGAVWLTGTYDPGRNLTYWGVGNGGPWTGDARPGDNLFTNSTVALDADSGALSAYHQYHWNGSWDWDEAVAPLLVDVERGGRAVPSLVHPGRDGYLWLLDREAGGIRFLEAQPFVHHNVFTGIDPFSGRPSYDPTHVPRIGYRALYCPSIAGGRGWRPEAFSPRTRLLYVPVINNLCSIMEGQPVEYRAGEVFVGAKLDVFDRNGRRDVVFTREGARHVGELQAWNLDTGQRAWVREFPTRGGSVLATAGDLVFFDVGGALQAFDALSGEPLWKYSLNRRGPTGVAVTYAVSGVQYVAVQFEAPARRVDIPGAPPAGSVVIAFALDCQC